MEIGKVLYQQDVQGIPRLSTLKGAVEVQLPNADVDAAAKWAVNEYNKKTGAHLVFLRTLVGWALPVPVGGTFYFILFKTTDGGVYFSAVFISTLMNFLLLFIHIFG